MQNNINNMNDIIDVRDLIARVETLRDELSEAKNDTSEEFADMELSDWILNIDIDNHPFADTINEYILIDKLLSDLCGYGGDEQWEGDWYPVTLIRESHFTEYAQELADDIGAMTTGDKWPYTCIDWEQAARELKMDYSTVEYDGTTYFYR